MEIKNILDQIIWRGPDDTTNFSFLNLSYANFVGRFSVDFKFTKSNLYRANFVKGSFKNCDFSWADLSQANLGLCDLSGSNFSNARITGANFENAKLDGIMWGENASRPILIGPIGSRNDYLRIQKIGLSFWFETGCFKGWKSEFILEVTKNHTNNTTIRDKYLTIAEMCESFFD